jgi:hypothetical protein
MIGQLLMDGRMEPSESKEAKEHAVVFDRIG